MTECPVMIITGASRGIGAATARLAAQRGYAVCVNYQNATAAAEELVGQIIGAGGTAIACRADMSSEKDILAMFAEVDSKLGRISALVNNAATLETQMRLDTVSWDRLQRLFEVNVFGPMICAREAVRRMSTRHGGMGGAIVNVSSVAAKYGSPGEYIDYAATKGAVDTFTIGLAREVAEEGIRVNAVRPGVVYTEMHARGGEPGRVDRVRKSVPLQRGGEPDEIAAAILWLLSNEASYVTASIMDVTGGR